MSTSATVGTLKVLLQADTAAFTAAMANATSDVKKIGEALQKDLEPRQRAVNAAVRDFLGTDEIRRANEYATAIERVGGVSNLTEANQKKVNRAVTEAIGQYRALGQEAPSTLIRLQDETTKQVGAWDKANASLAKFGLSLGALSLAGAVTGLISVGRQAIEFGSHLTDLRDQTGLTLDELQRLNYAGATVGLTLDQIAGSVNKLQKNLGTEGSGVVQALKVLNLNLGDLQSMTPGAMFETMATAIGKVEDPTKRTQVAMALLGKSGAELLPLLLAKVKELGDAAPKMSDDTIEALDRFDDAWAKAKITVMSSIGSMIGAIADAPKKFSSGFLMMGSAMGGLSPALASTTSQQIAVAESTDKATEAAKRASSAQAAQADTTKKLTDEEKKAAEAARIHAERIQALADAFTGKSLAQKVNDIAAAYAVAVKQGGIMAQQIVVLSQDLQRLRDQGATLPPRLNAIADAFSRNAQVIQRELKPVLYDWSGVENGTMSLQDLERQFDRLVTPIGKIQKAIQDQLGPALKNIPPAPVQTLSKDLSALAGSFEQIANIAGPSMSSVVRAIGTVVASVSQLQKSMDAFNSGTAAGMASGLAGAFAFGFGTAATIASIADSMQTPEFLKIMQDVGRTWGVQVSRGVGEAIKKSEDILVGLNNTFDPTKTKEQLIKQLAAIGPGQTRAAAEALNLSAIIGDAGGLNSKNLDEWAARAQKLFDIIGLGGTIGAQATSELGRVMGLFADQAQKAGGLWGTSFQSMIAQARELGAGLDEINRLIDGQLSAIAASTTKVAGGLGGRLSAPSKTLEGLTSQQKDQADRGDLSGAAETARQIKDLTTKTVSELQPEFDRLNRITLASFNAYIAQGHTAVEAIAAVGPAFDQLKAAADKFGFAGSEAFNQLSHWRDLTTANQPLLDQVSGLNDLMVALANVGSLDASTFADLQAQGLATFQQLTAAGFTQNEALAQMAPMLQTIKDLHDQNGLAIDDATQALINQADAQGVLKDKQESTQDVLMEGLGAIIKAVGGDMPAAWDKAAKAGKDAAKDIKGALSDIPDKTVKINFDTSDWPNTNDWPQPNGDGGGSGTPDGYPGNAPGYAVGGVVQPKPGGRLVRVAEAGYAETILPGNWSDLLEATRRMPNWDGAMAGVGLSAAGMTAPESAGPMSLNIGVGDVHIDGKKAGKVLWKPMVEDLQRRQLTR